MADPKLITSCFSGDTTECTNTLIPATTGNLNTLSTFATGYYSNSTGALNQPLTVGSATDGWFITDINFTPEGSVEGWFKSDGWSLTNTTVSDASQHRIYIDGDGSDLKLWPYIHPGEGLHFNLVDDSGSKRITCTTCTLSADTWYHIAFSWSASQNLMKIFIDGVEVASSTVALTITSLPALELYIGSFKGETIRGWDGWIDGFCYWNYMKTDFGDRNNKRRGMNDLIL